MDTPTATAPDERERLDEAEAFLRSLGIDRPRGAQAWRESKDQALAQRPASRRPPRTSAPPLEARSSVLPEVAVRWDDQAGDFKALPARARLSHHRAKRIYEVYVPKIAAACSQLEVAIIEAEIEREAGEDVESRTVVFTLPVSVRGVRRVVRVSVDACRKCKHQPSRIAWAALLKAAGASERDIATETGIPRATLGRILQAI
jgi:hypothetical protein